MLLKKETPIAVVEYFVAVSMSSYLVASRRTLLPPEELCCYSLVLCCLQKNTVAPRRTLLSLGKLGCC